MIPIEPLPAEQQDIDSNNDCKNDEAYELLKQLQTPKTEEATAKAEEEEQQGEADFSDKQRHDEGNETAPPDATSPPPRNKTKELLQLARQSASEKLAAILPKTNTNTSGATTMAADIERKKVLRREESPAFANPVLNSQSILIDQPQKKFQIQIQKSVQLEPVKSSPLLPNNCAQCGLKMSLLKPYHCMRCNRSFCPEHVPRSFSDLTFELYDSRRRCWQRVCEACHSSEVAKRRPVKPTSRSLFGYFSQVRAEFHDFREIEATRLQRRLEKLADFRPEQKLSFSAFERRIVPWQADESSRTCPSCSCQFTALSRKHHCRLCGRLTCHACLAAKTIPLRLRDGSLQEIKNCSTCHFLLFQPKTPALPPSLLQIQKLYQTASALKQQILETIPKFNELLLRPTPTAQQIHDIWALRDTLILVSLHFKSTLSELADLAESESESEGHTGRWKILAENVRRAGNLFIQRHMFTLQILEEAPAPAAVEGTDRPASEVETTSPTVAQSPPPPIYKKFIPDALIEAFINNSLPLEHDNSSQVSLGLYQDDGSPIEANREAIELKRAVLHEQIAHLQCALKQEDSEEAKLALKESVDQLAAELKKLSRIKM